MARIYIGVHTIRTLRNLGCVRSTCLAMILIIPMTMSGRANANLFSLPIPNASVNYNHGGIMKIYKVVITNTYEVEADDENDAEAIGIDLFDFGDSDITFEEIA